MKLKRRASREPKLGFVNQQGEFGMEYLPPENYRIMNWLRDQYILLRMHLGRDIYYWHFRHSYSPYLRKIGDIEFINHVINEHNSEPDDRIERRQYDWAWTHYGHEMTYVINEVYKDKGKNVRGTEIAEGHQYAYAYVDRWYRDPDPQKKILFHGLKWPDYLDTSRSILEREQIRQNEYYKKHNLDPDTGKKLKPKKKVNIKRAKKSPS